METIHNISSKFFETSIIEPYDEEYFFIELETSSIRFETLNKFDEELQKENLIIDEISIYQTYLGLLIKVL